MRASTILAIAVALSYIIIQTVYGMKSEEEIIEEAKIKAANVFEETENPETNYEINSFSFYLPENMNVMESDANNIILNSENQTYIVFYNKFEDAKSKLNYEAAKNRDALLLESFSNDTMFGYIVIRAGEDKKYEMQIGVGGVKITTYTTIQKMEEDAGNLMKIAQSLALTME